MQIDLFVALHFFSPFLRHHLSLGVEIKNLVADDNFWKFAQNIELSTPFCRRLMMPTSNFYEMGDGGNNLMRSFFDLFSPFLWRHLSLGVEIKNQVAGDHLRSIRQNMYLWHLMLAIFNFFSRVWSLNSIYDIRYSSLTNRFRMTDRFLIRWC